MGIKEKMSSGVKETALKEKKSQNKKNRKDQEIAQKENRNLNIDWRWEMKV